ncbi:S8 family serine peptidase [Glaciecola siphonariae]|uniref:S8 family serine peptidase n=1 Tax=Glaciecola siphonariae TaxID=521012 RepID=A0ABV9LZ02_9ALTE
MLHTQKRFSSFGVFALSALAFNVAAATQSPSEVTSALDKALQQEEVATVGKTSPISGKDLKNLVRNAASTERYMVVFKETKESAPTTNRSGGIGPAVQQAVVNGLLQEDVAAGILSRAGAQKVRTMPKHNMVVVKMDKKAAYKLSQNPTVDYISLDPRRELQAETTPYGISMVQATQLNQNDPGRRKVCVIDTGYNLGHPDLPDQNDGVTGQANNNQVGNWWNDGNGHGTHVAGTIGAIANNEGVVGVYPGVNMHIVKIFNDSGSWTFASDIIDAISQCQSAGSNVVNMSLGGGSSSTAERNAMQGFVDDGMMLVAAAGNDGTSGLSYPASYPAVISVAAVDSSERRASYSQFNNAVEIAGPGSAVSSTWPVNTYRSISGTSMATPHVAGAAALVWSFFRQCSNEQIRNALNVTAKDKGSAGKDTSYGHGIVQARDAYDFLATNGCDGNSGGGGGGVTPVSGQLSNLSDSTNNWKRYSWTIPAGVSTLTIRISGGRGDADLYLRYGSDPQTNRYDCRPYRTGNTEVCTINNPQAGAWKIGIRAYATYSGVTMNYSYE